MKNFKEFKSEQQYVTEIGPIAATLMGAMALWGGYKAYKGVKKKIKGYKETKKEKKDNKEKGVFIKLKVFDKETGKMTTKTKIIAEPGKRGAAMSNAEVEKKKKELQKEKDIENDKAEFEYETEIAPKKEKEKKEKGEQERSTMSASDWVDEPIDDIPDDMEDEVKKLEREKMGGHKDVVVYMKRWGLKDPPNGWKKDKPGAKNFQYVKSEPAGTESTMLKFGEFIAEDIIKDLKKASKSKKDVEISLDDGADIPIDPMTAEIFVKYIEGLSSSEKNKTIKQIQRTERGFMKVLGKAHEG